MSTLRSMFWSLVAYCGLISFVAMSLLPAAAWGAPVVVITKPADGAVVYGQTMIEVAYRSDSEQPIVAIQLLVDGQLARHWLLPVPRLEGRQNFSWDFTFAAATTHTIKAKAIDAEGEEGSASIVVEVKKVTTEAPDQIPPAIQVYYPAQGAKVSGDVQIKANATDNVGVTTVFFYVDGVFKTMIMHAPPYTTKWDTTKVPDGPHILQAKAWDAAENEAGSAEVTVIVENRAMTTAPQAFDVIPTQPTVAPMVVAPVPAPTPLGEGTTDQQQFGSPTEPVSQPEEPAGSPPEVIQSPAAIPAGTTGAETTIATLPGHTGVASAGTSRPTQLGSPVATGGAVGSRLAEAGWLLAAAVPTPFRPTAVAGSHNTSPAEMIKSTSPVGGPALTSVLPPVLAKTQWDTGSAAETEIAALAAQPILTTLPADAAVRNTVPQTESVVRPGITESVLTSPAAGAGWLAIAARPTAANFATAPATRTARPVGDSASWPLRVGPARATDAAPASLTANEYQLVMIPRSTAPSRPYGNKVTTPTTIPAVPAAVAAVKDIKIVFDGDLLDLRAAPELKEGISIAPLREIFEHTDGVLYWFHVEKKVHAISEDLDMHLEIGNPQVQVNEETETLVLAPYIKHGRTMVPLQFLADTLNVTIRFNPATGQVVVSSNDL